MTSADAGDYVVWKTNFGIFTANRSLAASQAVPEPFRLVRIVRIYSVLRDVIQHHTDEINATASGSTL